MPRRERQRLTREAKTRGDCYLCGKAGTFPVDEFGGHKCPGCVQDLAQMRMKYALKKVDSPMWGDNATGYRLKGDVR
jgi:hypothetical protein